MVENDEKLTGKHRKAFFKLYNFLAENDFSFVLHFPLFCNLVDLGGVCWGKLIAVCEVCESFSRAFLTDESFRTPARQSNLEVAHISQPDAEQILSQVNWIQQRLDWVEVNWVNLYLSFSFLLHNHQMPRSGKAKVLLVWLFFSCNSHVFRILRGD